MFVVSWLQLEPLPGTVSSVSCKLRTHLRSMKKDCVNMILIHSHSLPPITIHANQMRTAFVPPQTWLARLTTDIRLTSEGSIDLIDNEGKHKKISRQRDES